MTYKVYANLYKCRWIDKVLVGDYVQIVQKKNSTVSRETILEC